MDPDRDNKSHSDVLLVFPKTGIDLGSAITPPHSLLALAAPLLREGYRIRIIDQRTDPNWRRNLAWELEGRPLCVGISCMVGAQIFYALEAAKLVRQKARDAVPIVWGGPHPSTMPEQTLRSDHVDVVCIGEGEDTFVDLLRSFSSRTPLAAVRGIGFKNGGKPVVNPQREQMDVETLLPTPWNLIRVEDYIRPDFYLKSSVRTLDIGQTSRGCAFNCGFCSSASIRGRKWRALSSEKSVALITDAVRRFKLDGVWIRDDEFYIDRKRTSGICEGILRNNLNISWYTAGTRVDLFNRATDEEVALMRKSGVYALKSGVESGSNRILQLINKGVTWQEALDASRKANRHGIVFGYSLMIGFPTETFEEIYQTIDLAQRIEAENPSSQLETIATYTPLPGTPLFAMALENGLKPPETLEGWIHWDFWDYDLDGSRIPWFDRKGRKRIGNIGYLHTMAYAFPNLVDSVNSRMLRNGLKTLAAPMAAYSRLRIRTRRLDHAPELSVLRFLRRKVFQRGGIRLRRKRGR